MSGRKKKDPPFSLRLSFEERARLEQLAGEMPLGTYIKAKVFDGKGIRNRRSQVEDQSSLARVLAKLGQSRLSSNLNQLAKSANIGTLPVTPETEDDLRRACQDIALMRQDLLKALGQRADLRSP